MKPGESFVDTLSPFRITSRSTIRPFEQFIGVIDSLLIPQSPPFFSTWLFRQHGIAERVNPHTVNNKKILSWKKKVFIMLLFYLIGYQLYVNYWNLYCQHSSWAWLSAVLPHPQNTRGSLVIRAQTHCVFSADVQRGIFQGWRSWYPPGVTSFITTTLS